VHGTQSIYTLSLSICSIIRSQCGPPSRPPWQLQMPIWHYARAQPHRMARFGTPCLSDTSSLKARDDGSHAKLSYHLDPSTPTRQVLTRLPSILFKTCSLARRPSNNVSRKPSTVWRGPWAPLFASLKSSSLRAPSFSRVRMRLRMPVQHQPPSF